MDCEWEQIKIDEEPEWQEWQRTIICKKAGVCILRLWIDYGGAFKSSITTPENSRYVMQFTDAKDIDEAKKLAVDWASDI
ncbi:MAG: hypothetical protein ACRBCS_02925 [Cellvibrionaceae bacterium]